MKRFVGFLAVLCLFFTVNAQGLKIGDAVPDVLVKNISGLVISGKPVTEARLSAFRGKLLIVDFWATWCAPCRRMVPVMDSLQRVFKSSVQFLPVTYETEKMVAPVLAAMRKVKEFDLPEVTGDVALNKLFPHRYLPHYAWISPIGTVLAVTEEKEVTADNIRRILSGSAGMLKLKRDSVVVYNAALPLLVGGNGGDGSGLVYHSLLSSYKPGLTSGTTISRFDETAGQLFTARNVPFPWLCRLAYSEDGRSFPPARTRILTRDSARMTSGLSGQAFISWLADGNGWCYQLLLLPKLSGSAFAFMQADLVRLFPGYSVRVEQRNTRCLSLVRIGAADKLKTAGGETIVDISPYKARLKNAQLSQLIMRLEDHYLQESKLPVVDATGYTGPVDLAVDCRLDDIIALNRALAPYGLAFKEQDASVDMLVISDAKITKP